MNNNDIIKAIDSIDRIQKDKQYKEDFSKKEGDMTDKGFGDILKQEQDKLRQKELLQKQKQFLNSLQMTYNENITKMK